MFEQSYLFIYFTFRGTMAVYHLLMVSIISSAVSVFLEMFLILSTPCLHSDAQGSGGSKPLPTTSLIHETDLVVSINDLDNLFNSDEDDLTVSTVMNSPDNHCLNAHNCDVQSK